MRNVITAAAKLKRPRVDCNERSGVSGLGRNSSKRVSWKSSRMARTQRALAGKRRDNTRCVQLRVEPLVQSDSGHSFDANGG